MPKTKNQIDRQTAIDAQNANTQSQLANLRQSQATESKNFLAPPSTATQGGLQGPILTSSFGTGAGGSAFLLPTDYGTEPEMDRVWEQPVLLPDIKDPSDIDLEEVKPLEDLEQVPYLTEEYRNGIATLNDLSVGARSAGFNIKKPDSSDPRQMKAYTLFSQIKGETASLGASLQEGYKAQELIAKDPEKYARALLNKEAGATRATRYSDLVSDDIDPSVSEFNKRVQALPRITSKDDPAYTQATRQYTTLKNTLTNRYYALMKEGKEDEAYVLNKSIKTLEKPYQTFSLEEEKLDLKKKERKDRVALTRVVERESTDLFNRIVNTTKNPGIYKYDSATGVFTTDLLTGFKYDGKQIAKITLGDENGGNIFGTNAESKRYYSLVRRQKNFQKITELTPSDKEKFLENEKGFRQYLSDLEKQTGVNFDIHNYVEYDADGKVSKGEDGNVIVKTLSQKEIDWVDTYEKNMSDQITIWVRGEELDDEGQKTGNEKLIPKTVGNNANSLLDAIVSENGNNINKDDIDRIKQDKNLYTAEGDLDYRKILPGQVMIDYDKDGDGELEKIPIDVDGMTSILKSNWALQQGKYEVIYDEINKFLDPSNKDANQGMLFWGRSDSSMKFNVESNSNFPNFKSFQVNYDNWDRDEFDLHISDSEEGFLNPLCKQARVNVAKRNNKSLDDLSNSSEEMSREEVLEFLKLSKTVENDKTAKQRGNQMVDAVTSYQKQLSKNKESLYNYNNGKETQKFYESQLKNVPLDPQTGESQKKSVNGFGSNKKN